MLPSIRRWALVFLAAGFSLLAHAQYPDKPIKIIVPYPPGGTTDLLARSLAPRLS